MAQDPVAGPPTSGPAPTERGSKLLPQLMPDPVAETLPAWMAGMWEERVGNDWSEQFWMPPVGGMMLGASRKGQFVTVQDWELTRLVHNDNGAIVLIVLPKGGAAVEFPMVRSSADSIEFANAAHDFPQVIRYSREGSLLMAEVSKIDGSGAVRWNYRKMAVD